jgi:xylulokinase
MAKALYVGGDLGTSSLKLVLVDEKGTIIRSSNVPYDVSYPAPGYSEQEASSYVEALKTGLGRLITDVDKPLVKGIAIDGQMHGLVALDEEGKPLRPVILWNDSRSKEECDYLNKEVGEKTLLEETGNIAYPGFTLPKILWMKKHERELYKKIAHVLLPKDYLTYYLTGNFATDYSDAAGTLLLNVKEKKWSEKMVKISGLSSSVLPPLHQSKERVGTLREEVAQELGLSSSVFVLAGAGDNAASAMGVGAALPNHANISLGTSGTIALTLPNYAVSPDGSIHSFLGVQGETFMLSCMLSCASCLKWFLEEVLRTRDYDISLLEIKLTDLGKNEVYFLPYLMGERSPLNDPYARGAFIGLTPTSGRVKMLQATLEGVAFGLKDGLESLRALGGKIEEATLTGGGAQNPIWPLILADVLNLKLNVVSSKGGASYGMALLCLVADGVYPSIEEAEKTLRSGGVVTPYPNQIERYEKRYEEWKLLYPSLKGVFPLLHQ